MSESAPRANEAQALLRLCGEHITAEREMGRDVSEAERLARQATEALEAGSHDRALCLAAEAMEAVRRCPMRPDWPYVEPQDLDSIRAEWPGLPPPAQLDLDDETLYDRIYGGWLGKNIGGALGGPVEGWTREAIAETHGELTDYVQQPSTLNDDTAYEIIALHVVERAGREFTARDLGLEWVERLPKAYTAEEVALANLKRGIMPPASALVDNPYREWIGAQMRGEVWGLLCPGRPLEAAEYAYRDAIVSNDRNGVYGELYDAALIAAAFVESDPRRLLEHCLGVVPRRSRFTQVVRDTISWCEQSSSWQAAWAQAERSHGGRYHPVHAFPALCAVIIGLLFGAGDFGRSICITTMCGLDTDCSAGQVGAILGVIQGAARLPARWKDPIGDEFETFVIGYERLRTSEVARWTQRLRLA